MKRLKWILLVLFLLILAGGGAAAFLMRDKVVSLAMQLLGKEPMQMAAAPPPDPNAPPVLGTYYELPNVFGTIESPGHIPHIIHMQIGIFMHDPADIIWIQAYLPRIMDTIQSYLHDDMILDKQHPIRIDVLREVLLKRINDRIAPARITKVVVNTMVVG